MTLGPEAPPSELPVFQLGAATQLSWLCLGMPRRKGSNLSKQAAAVAPGGAKLIDSWLCLTCRTNRV